jgi:hypothetical protein
MIVKYGEGTTTYGPGVEIKLTGSELARAIDVWLLSQQVIVQGPRTITYNGELLEDSCRIYVDPSGSVIHCGERLSGRGSSEPSPGS